MSRKAPITVLLDLDVIHRLEEKAKVEDKPLSQVLREMINKGLSSDVKNLMFTQKGDR